MDQDPQWPVDRTELVMIPDWRASPAIAVTWEKKSSKRCASKAVLEKVIPLSTSPYWLSRKKNEGRKASMRSSDRHQAIIGCPFNSDEALFLRLCALYRIHKVRASEWREKERNRQWSLHRRRTRFARSAEVCTSSDSAYFTFLFFLCRWIHRRDQIRIDSLLVLRQKEGERKTDWINTKSCWQSTALIGRGKKRKRKVWCTQPKNMIFENNHWWRSWGIWLTDLYSS